MNKNSTKYQKKRNLKPTNHYKIKQLPRLLLSSVKSCYLSPCCYHFTNEVFTLFRLLNPADPLHKVLVRAKFDIFILILFTPYSTHFLLSCALFTINTFASVFVFIFFQKLTSLYSLGNIESHDKKRHRLEKS